MSLLTHQVSSRIVGGSVTKTGDVVLGDVEEEADHDKSMEVELCTDDAVEGSAPDDDDEVQEGAIEMLAASLDIPKTDCVDSLENAHNAVTFLDHYTLQKPSSTVRYRGARVLIYEQKNHQVVLEDREEGSGHRVTVKRADQENLGVTILRTSYTLVSLLMLGFLFLLCVQIVMFVFLNLPAHTGFVSGGVLDPLTLVGTILSIPAFLYSMGSLIALGSTFVADTWSGHSLMQLLLGWPPEIIEWLSFSIFLAIPSIAICITLFAGLDNWWSISARIWTLCISFYFALFCLAVLIREVGSCFDLVSIQEKQKHKRKDLSSFRIAKLCIEITQTERYSAIRNEKYIVHGANNQPKTGYHNMPLHEPVKVSTPPYSFLINLLCPNFIFQAVDPPQLRYSVQAIEGSTPFVTNHSWSLEKFFCKAFNSEAVTAFSGPSALRNNQIMSSLVCINLGLLIILLLICSSLKWMNIGWIEVIVVALFATLCLVVPIALSTLAMYHRFHVNANDDWQSNSIHMDQDNENNDVVMFSI